jgi:enoyl-CoA hydratase
VNKFNAITTSLEAGICTITISRPEKMNALNAEVIRELGIAVAEVYTNDNIAAAIVTGAGPKAFVAGADIASLRASMALLVKTWRSWGNNWFSTK